jgi:hypothetical protein
MKHLKKYENYITEELREEEKRMILHSPLLIGGFLLKKIFKLFPLLNYRYKEIKKKTNDSNFRSIIATSSSDGSQVKEPWRKITKEDFPKSKLGFGLMLDKWNFYIKEGGNDPSRVDRVKRDFIYITKDEINVGDYITGDRLSDRDVYDLSGFKKDGPLDETGIEDFLQKNPAVVVCAKFDNIEKSEDVKVYIEDVLISEWEEYLYPERSITSNKQSDKYIVTIRLDEVYDEKLGLKADRVAKRISGYLRDENFGDFETKVNFKFDDNNTNQYYLLRNFRLQNGVNVFSEYNEKLKLRILNILGGDIIDKINKSPFKNTSIVSEGSVGSNPGAFYSINRLGMADHNYKLTTELMNKLNNNKDIIYKTPYSSETGNQGVSEIKVNKIQFIVYKIH